MKERGAATLSRKRPGLTLILLAAVLGAWIMAAVAAAASAAASAPSAAFPAGADPSAVQQQELGKAIYAEHCEVCHGVEGDGAGPAAENMDPRPRDFRRGWYKILTTAPGQLPTDEDLFRIIARGMPGTTMPGWEGVLSEEETRAVAAYIKTFSRRFEREKPAPVEVSSKMQADAESIARGQEIYTGTEAECIKCHGPSGRGDGPSADELTEDAFGDVIVPADLTMPWLFRGGPSVDDIYMRLMTGVTGTPMPSFADVLSQEDIWHVANYVDSLGADTPGEVDPVIRAAFVQGALPDQPDAEAWQAAEETYYPLFGQMMAGTRNYTPSIPGVWVKALYNDREIALLVRWHDRFPDTGQNGTPPDAFAVQFPAELPEGDERPYFVFGDPAHPVNLWSWNAAVNGVEESLAQGVDTQVSQATQNLQGNAANTEGEYTLMLRRELQTGDEQDIPFELGRFIPIAFIASDGWRGEELSSGSISSWFSIYLEKPVAAVTYAWIPAAIGLTALLEAWTVWSVRRRSRGQSPQGKEPQGQEQKNDEGSDSLDVQNDSQ